MGVTLSISTTETTLPAAVFKSLKAVQKHTSAYNIDLMRAALSRVASNHGLTCVIDPLTAGKDRIDWIVLFDGHQVAALVETGIGKSANPVACPSCGKLDANAPPRTNAHNVVSASIWRAVFKTVFAKWFGAEETRTDDGIKDLVSSLEKVASSTARSSYNGAATQGDRRTCKTCENLQGGLSLMQRRQIADEALTAARDDEGKVLSDKFNSFIGANYGQSNEHRLGFLEDIDKEITRQRIEDVVRGIALEIRNRFKYMESAAAGGLQWKQKYAFMARFDGDDYFDFLDEIRQEAFRMATGKPIDEHEATGALKQIVLNNSGNNAGNNSGDDAGNNSG